MNHKIYNVMITWLLALALSACGTAATTTSSGSSDSSGDVALSSIDELPLTTAPVVEGASASLAKSWAKGASTGVVLKTLSADDFDENSSKAMCHASQMLKNQLASAGQADLIGCYIQNGLDSLVYDGSTQKFMITAENDDSDEHGIPDGGAFYVEISASKDESGAISSYTMKSCEGEEQTEYLSYDIDGAGVSILAKHTFSDEEGAGSFQTTVTGTVNADGEFLSKNIETKQDQSWASGGVNGTTTVVQTAGGATMTVTESGTFNDGDEFAMRAYAEMELVNDDDLDTLAIGDGAAVVVESGHYEDELRMAWLGDTAEDISIDDSEYSDLSADDVPAVAEDVAISFAESEQTSCDSTGATTVTVDMLELNAACSDLEIDWSWFSCYDVIENGNPHEIDEEEESEEE